MKIFCIGLNKTRTTSLHNMFHKFGYKINNQHKAERMLDQYISNNFDGYLKYCELFDFFQDVPFSLPKTYEILEKKFPNAKFILSVRNDSETWVNSLIKYHNKVLYHGRKPTKSVVVTEIPSRCTSASSTGNPL